MNSIIEPIAQALYEAEGPEAQHARRQPRYALISELRKQGFREKVEAVLLAALNAGFAISDVRTRALPLDEQRLQLLRAALLDHVSFHPENVPAATLLEELNLRVE